MTAPLAYALIECMCSYGKELDNVVEVGFGASSLLNVTQQIKWAKGWSDVAVGISSLRRMISFFCICLFLSIVVWDEKNRALCTIKS